VSANATPAERFVAEHAEDAIISMRESGVPASVTLAQAILESNSGKSLLSTKAQNYFGIKARGKEGPAGVVYMDTWEVIGGDNVTQREPFRAYNDASESFADHGLYLRENARYAAAFRHTDDAREFARLIHEAGYATDPNYSSKLIKLMDTYDLYQFDR
jgi:flagellum-specific peptidoglycan hydrolase FlgJ